MTTSTKLQERAHLATIKFLERRGYEILDDNPDLEGIDLVAQEADTVVFVQTAVREGTDKGFSSLRSSRDTLETSAALWLSKQEKTDIRCRFDHISLMVLSENKAFLRHHINVLGSSEA